MTSSLSTPLLQLPTVDILIVGLGPGAVYDITLGVWHALLQGQSVYLRTLRHPCVETIQAHRSVENFDYLYEEHEAFEEVYAVIAKRVIERALAAKAVESQEQVAGVVYAVPGHPWIGEATTPLIQTLAKEAGLSVAVIGGASFVEASFGAVGVDLMDGGQVVDAMLLAKAHNPHVEPTLPLLIGQVYARWLASDLKLTLLNSYPPEHSVTVIQGAGTAQEQVTTRTLFEMDHSGGFDHLTSLYVPPLEAGGSFTALLGIVAHLRAPEGCPWDREQTLESLRHDLLDEAAEVLEAIDAEAAGGDNTANIVEELGDLLLLPAMMTQIATEEGRFQMADVTRGIVNKLIRRHPHVFGEVVTDNVDEIVVNWDAIKAQEKAERGDQPRGPLDGIPAGLPALEKARKLQSKAQKAGLLEKDALAQSAPFLFQQFLSRPSEEALGRFLWSLVALAKESDLNSENALRTAVVEFRQKQTYRSNREST